MLSTNNTIEKLQRIMVSFGEQRRTHIYKLDDFWRINEIHNDKNAYILMCKVKAAK